jgi:sn-glycerol 3-phosphate transport system ATP-binding protein
MSFLVLQNLQKRWRDTPVLNDVSFTVEQGEFCTLLGASGCGKSTTLRIVAGLEQPDSGEILLNSRDMLGRSPAERELSMVFQSYALFPHLSVRENLLFGLKVRRESRQGFAKRLDRVVELMGLEGLLDRRPSQLSGGQQQRVALGRAVIADRPLCLMDEPLSNLDAKLRQRMRRDIRALQQALGMTVLYVTHDQTEAMSMSDKVVLLNGGRVEQFAAPQALYQRPATVFAARFIGAPPMNILNLAVQDGHLCLLAADKTHPVAKAMTTDACQLGVRAEDIRLVSATIGLPVRVASVEYLGAEALVQCRLGENDVLVRTAQSEPPSIGAWVGLQWPTERQHFFDAASGRRLDSEAYRQFGTSQGSWMRSVAS